MSKKYKNLTHKLTVEDQRKGVEASKARRKSKKVIKEILSDVLSLPVKSVPAFSTAAKKMGIDDNKSIKEFYVIVCLMNEMKEGNLDSLAKLMEMMKETSGTDSSAGRYEPTSIIVLPSAKDGENVLPDMKKEADGESS